MTTPDERCMVDTSDPNLRWLKTDYIARAGDSFERTGRTQLCPASRHASHLAILPRCGKLFPRAPVAQRIERRPPEP